MVNVRRRGRRRLASESKQILIAQLDILARALPHQLLLLARCVGIIKNTNEGKPPATSEPDADKEQRARDSDIFLFSRTQFPKNNPALALLLAAVVINPGQHRAKIYKPPPYETFPSIRPTRLRGIQGIFCTLNCLEQ